MVQPSPLHDSLQRAITRRYKGTGGMGIRYINDPLPSQAPDFFSSDYLSLASDDSLREIFSRKVQEALPGHLFGSTGSRLLTGNSSEINVLERALAHFLGGPAALLFSSGFSANSAFLAHVPQEHDVIVYDESIHASCREGIRLSSRTSYSFSHNSVASLEECLLGVLRNHPQVTRGASTVFVVVESLYSMDGDFCPLPEIVQLVEALVPAGHAHITVDEAHTSGICGPDGTGYVSYLGLSDRIHTKIHAFSKAWGFHGAVLLTSPIIKDYLVNFTKNIMFSTAMPYIDVYALEACFSVVSSSRGQELRKTLNHLCRYAREKLFIALGNVPKTILTVAKPDATTVPFDPNLCSPIIPVLTPHAKKLGEYLLERGYAVTPLPCPIVQSPMIRVTIHAGNTEGEIDAFIGALVAWAQRQERVSARSGRVGRSAGEPYTQAKAKM